MVTGQLRTTAKRLPVRGTPEVGVPGTGVLRAQSCLTESEAAGPAYCCTSVFSERNINESFKI